MPPEKKPANNAIDFNTVRKKRRRLTNVKRLVILLAIFGGVILVLVANSWMIERGITTQLSDLIGGIGGSGYPVDVPGGVIRDVKGAGNHLAVLNDANLLIYNDKGRQTANIQAMTGGTVLLASADRFLTFDVGARRFAVHSSTQTPFEMELEYGIFAGGMNAAGDFAIVSSSEQAICEINVYNDSFADIYYCTLAENLATAVSIAPRGDRMAVGWLSGKGGMLLSGVNIYQFSNDEGPIAALELGEDLILDVLYIEDDRIGVLTDRRYLVMGTGGEIMHSYIFDGPSPTAFKSEGRQTLFKFQNGASTEIVLLDGECAEQAILSTDEKVADLALSSRRVYILTDSGIDTYDHELMFEDEWPLQFGTHIELVGSRLYYLGRDVIGVLGGARREDPTAAAEPEPGLEPLETEPEVDTELSEPEPETDTEPPETDPDDEPAGEEGDI